MAPDDVDSEDIAAFGRLIDTAERIVVLTGAGISTESGVPDFRGPGGVWTRMTPITYGEFIASEAARMEDWRRRFVMNASFYRAVPNAGHAALTEMARSGRLAVLITQNIDGLHQRAGFPPQRLIELHGAATHGRCVACRAPMTLDDVRARIEATGSAPRCACGAPVKAAIISFGEKMPEGELRRATEHAAAADLFVVIGSSLQVRPAATLPFVAKRAGAALAIVNRDPTPLDADASIVIRKPIGKVFSTLFPQLANRL